MTDYKIRLATIDDIQRINELFIEMIGFVNGQRSDKEANEEQFKNGYEEGFLEDYLTRHDRFIYVAEVSSQVVGYLSCEEHSSDDSTFIYLDDFCVDASYRSQGIGTALVQSALDYALSNNFDNLRLHVDNENANSIRFYSNLDFKPVSNDERRTLLEKSVSKDNKLGI